MLSLELTSYGIDKINNSIIDSSYFLDIAKIKGNYWLSEVSRDSLKNAVDLPTPLIEGYVNTVNYDRINNAIAIQGILFPEQSFCELNAIGLFDNDDNMVAFILHRAPIKYEGQLIRYFCWMPILSQNGSSFDPDNLRIVLPKNQVVHQTYTFEEGSVWMVRHHLQTPLVNFTLYDRLNQYIPDSEYDAFANPGNLSIIFKNGKSKAGYCSIIAEGFAMSHQGKTLSKYDPNNVEYIVDDPTTWAASMIIDD